MSLFTVMYMYVTVDFFPQGAGIRRQPGSSTSSDNSNRYMTLYHQYYCVHILQCVIGIYTCDCLLRSQAPPPRSLQELLERQWEQTAQFILDQAGKQNNGKQCQHIYSMFVYEVSCYIVLLTNSLSKHSILHKFKHS